MAVNVYRNAIEIPEDRVIVALDGMGWRETEGAQRIAQEIKEAS